MSRFAAVTEKAEKAAVKPKRFEPETASNANTAPSRQGKKAITGYFSPELSLAMHTAARRRGISLQEAMGEAFNNWLRDNGESPVGL